MILTHVSIVGVENTIGRSDVTFQRRINREVESLRIEGGWELVRIEPITPFKVALTFQAGEPDETR